MRPLQHSNIPESAVCLCAIGAAHPYIITNALEQSGVSVLQLKPCLTLDARIQNHADLLLHHTGGKCIWLAQYDADAMRVLQKCGFSIQFTQTQPQSAYPNDIMLNCLAVKGKLFGNLKYTDHSLLNYYRKRGVQFVHLPQGYARCATCIVDQNSIITADSSIVHHARLHGLDVLQITAGHIQLRGYDYGFIGGCSGLLAANKLAFAGDISLHPDADKIYDFCYARNVELINLIPGCILIDIGTIVPLMESFI